MKWGYEEIFKEKEREIDKETRSGRNGRTDVKEIIQ